MTFDANISLGTIIQTALLLIAVGAVIVKIAKIDTKVDVMWRAFMKRFNGESDEHR